MLMHGTAQPTCASMTRGQPSRAAARVHEQGGQLSTAAARERIKMSILEEAHIVCSTLSFSGSGLFTRMSRPFDVVVIDEAAQAVEPSTLVPLVTGCHQVCCASH
jgi:senataxin